MTSNPNDPQELECQLRAKAAAALEESIIKKVKIKAKETERTESNVLRILIKKAIDAGYLDQITL